MNINTNTIVSMTEANQNFSKVVKVAEKNGEAIIFKNNKPRFMLIDMESNPYLQLSDDEIQTVVELINTRLRKCLNWKTPQEIFFEECVALF